VASDVSSVAPSWNNWTSASYPLEPFKNNYGPNYSPSYYHFNTYIYNDTYIYTNAYTYTSAYIYTYESSSQQLYSS
jgi:hypothetical protein